MKKIFIIVLFSSFMLAENNETNRWTTTESIKEKLSITFDKNTTCYIRGIPLYKYPKWVSQIETNNGENFYFCSPKSMFEFYFKYKGKKKVFSKIIVTDFGSLKPVDAKKSYFVYGSRIVSIAGDDLVPFKNKKDAQDFANKHNGKRVLKFYEVKNALIRLLNGNI